jgi:hypothetical protein
MHSGSPADVVGSPASLDGTEPGSVRLLKAVVTAFIAVTLLSQFVIGFSYHGGHAFPILSYPMFSQAHVDGERLNDYTVYVSADEGPEDAYDLERMQMGWPLYQKVVAGPVIKGEKPDLIKDLAASVCEAHGAEVVTFKAYDSGYHISRSGPVEGDKKLMGSLELVCDEL